MISSSEARFVRPEITDSGPLALDGARHPILEILHDDYVPNKVFLSEVSSMAIITGLHPHRTRLIIHLITSVVLPCLWVAKP